MTNLRRFPIRFDSWYRPISSLVLLFPDDAYVEVRDDEVEVKMGWAFHASFPRAAVRGTSPVDGLVLSRGVHGLAGRWLVNGSGRGVLSLNLERDTRGRVLGVPVRLEQLLVSVDDRDELARALAA